MRVILLSLFIGSVLLTESNAQQSVARKWNEVLLDAIRADVSRPTVHARNLYHVSALMYDAWATYDDIADHLLLGRNTGEYTWQFDGVEIPDIEEERKAAQEEAISYAAYRLMKHRFKDSPGQFTTMPALDLLMVELGYDSAVTSIDYFNDGPAALGNYLAFSCMEYGLLDYADEASNYEYSDDFYEPVNPPLVPTDPGNPTIIDLNHWQPLAINANMGRRFLSPQWGKTTPFSLTDTDLARYDKNGVEYYVYYDPGAPPRIDTLSGAELDDYYKWNFALVAIWSGHLDPSNGVMIDISPNSVGNLNTLPSTEEDMRSFYQFLEGGVTDTGYAINPITGMPYQQQLVPMGDFGRVLAEFWADGPNSETPPGHWFTILNEVNDHPEFEKRFEGEGDVLDDLEWDVKAYLILGGAMHDVAVAVWGIKSYYDYIRPISAIRGMADLGQCSDTMALSYHPGGLPLVEDHIELVLEGDALAGEQNENVGKIKLFAWRGPAHIGDSESDAAGVGWILAENWWPYQSPSFITPPFAGYVSGHSTFSRAAAEVLTLLTGDEYFPGGMGVFSFPQGDYLIFEDGPSVDVQLQWAKYRDASDQASLSRIWGGIHPPVDDIPGRKIGMEIGPQAFVYAKQFFAGQSTPVPEANFKNSTGIIRNFPNPVGTETVFEYSVRVEGLVEIQIYDLHGRLIHSISEGIRSPGIYQRNVNVSHLNAGVYAYHLSSQRGVSQSSKLIVK